MITLHDIQPSDAKALYLLEESVFSTPWSEKSFYNDALNDNSKYVIAKNENSEIIGYCAYLKVIDEAQITNVAVNENYRNQGIAKLMLKELIKKAVNDGISIITLEVRKSNIPAINLYTSFDFKIVGCRKNYYQKPDEDALLMDLNLNRSTGGN